MSRLNDAGYTTSGRNSTGKSSAKKVAPRTGAVGKVAAKKFAPAPKQATPAKSKFPMSMSAPSGRPISKVSVPATGRDRFGPTARPAAKIGQRPGMNRQEMEAKIMSTMRRDRLGPGQK